MSTLLTALTKPSVTNEPPAEMELRRNDIAVLVLLIFALFLGWGIRNNAVNASKEVELGEGLPAISIPYRWIIGKSDPYVLQARNPGSASIFDAEVRVAVRPLNQDENLVTVRTGTGVRRSQELLRYRELSADPVSVDGAPGILVTYAYVADPTREAGAVAPPVVVQAQDLIFVSGDRVVIVTTAADAAEWDEDAPYFDMVHDSLHVTEAEATSAPGLTSETQPATESQPTEQEGAQ